MNIRQTELPLLLLSRNLSGQLQTDLRSLWDPALLSGKTGEDAASEFALGEAVFYQNGTWAYNDIKDNEVADEDLGMLPIYRENQGLCTGSRTTGV